MKKKSKIKKILNRKTDRTPMDVSTMQGDDKLKNDSNHIVIGAQVGIPEETKKKKKNKKKRPIPLTGIDLLKKRITFADFRKQSREINYGSDSI